MADRGQQGDLALQGVRVIDITGAEAGFLGKYFADFGADVILVPSPVPDLTREPVRLAGVDVDWFVRNSNKRVARDATPAALEPLLAGADLLFTSDGRAESLGFEPLALVQRFPRLVVVDATSFGRTGPRSSVRGSNLTLTAAGGYLNLCGAPAEPPSETLAPMGYGQAAAQAIYAALLGLRQRDQTGRGLLVDLSVQQAVIDSLGGTFEHAYLEQENDYRGPSRRRGNVISRSQYRCKDGFISWYWYVATGWGRKTEPVVRWMEELGIAGDLVEMDWENTSIFDVTQEMVNHWEESFGELWLRFTREEIFDEAVRRDILLAPVQTVADILTDQQLEARKYFGAVTLSDGTEVRLPGRYFTSTELPSLPIAAPPERGASTWREPPAAHSAPTHPERRLPLEGIRVIDFSWAQAGPISAKYLGLFGAEVIKVEWRARPDATRIVGPYVERPGIDRAIGFLNANVCKRSFALNISQQAGRDIARRLVQASDIVIENFRSGTMERLGLSYTQLKEAHPDLIMASLSMQGQTGPRATQPGVGSFFKSAVGIDALTPARSGAPAGPNYAYPDWVIPWFTVAGIVTALHQRDRGKGGAYLDLSQFETALHMLTPQIVRAQLGRSAAMERPAPPAPYGVYPARGEDRWCALAVWDDEQWRRLAQIVAEAWADDDAYTTASGRGRGAEQLDVSLSGWTSRWDPLELANRLQAAGVDCAAVARGEDILADSQLKARGQFMTMQHPRLGAVPFAGPSFTLSGCEPRNDSAPILGADTQWVCHEVLKLSDDEIADLATSGCLGG